MGTKIYSQARFNIESGDLIVWSNDNVKGFKAIMSHLIRFGTRSEYNHVGIACWMEDTLYVLEAKKPVVRLIPLPEDESIYHIPLGIEWKSCYTQRLLDYEGSKYSTGDAVKAFLKMKLDDDSRFQCAELVTDFYNNLGMNLENTDTPSLLVKEIMKKRNVPIYFIESGD